MIAWYNHSKRIETKTAEIKIPLIFSIAAPEGSGRSGIIFAMQLILNYIFNSRIITDFYYLWFTRKQNYLKFWL